MSVCQTCLGKCCRNIDTGYKCAHMGAQVYAHECDYCSDGTNPILKAIVEASNTMQSDPAEDVEFLRSERNRLIVKLAMIENMSRYAWEQVQRNPKEAAELLKMINLHAK